MHGVTPSSLSYDGASSSFGGGLVAMYGVTPCSWSHGTYFVVIWWWAGSRAWRHTVLVVTCSWSHGTSSSFGDGLVAVHGVCVPQIILYLQVRFGAIETADL